MTEYTKVASMYDMVYEFHATFGLAAPETPMPLSTKTAKLRKKLIEEESKELCDAIDKQDEIKMAKEAADLLYVTLGTAVSMGIDIEHIFWLVHQSNMSKLDLNGNPIIREDGKILKSRQYREPTITQTDLGFACHSFRDGR